MRGMNAAVGPYTWYFLSKSSNRLSKNVKKSRRRPAIALPASVLPEGRGLSRRALVQCCAPQPS